FLDKRERLKGRVRAALAYPVVVATVAAVIVSALTILVVPRFEQLFLTQLQGRPLPALTQSVLGVSRFMEARAGLLAGIVVVGAVALAAGGRRPRG
ncbi:MAG TPA: type II secretion system F family protein, partial [Opitutaceae bacterium]|nr:type II secretion system F family protein [Opitutaceae bacterium]